MNDMTNPCPVCKHYAHARTTGGACWNRVGCLERAQAGLLMSVDRSSTPGERIAFMKGAAAAFGVMGWAEAIRMRGLCRHGKSTCWECFWVNGERE